MTEKQIEQLTEINYWDSDWDEILSQLNMNNLSRLMYKFIEKNVQHDTEQRHMMYDLLDKIEEKNEL